jgi:hypothetical protein
MALAELLEDLKNRHAQGGLVGVDFLQELLKLALDVLSNEKMTPPVEREERVIAGLIRVFLESIAFRAHVHARKR